MQSNGKVDILNSSIGKALFKLAWPLVLTNLLQTMYNITDAFFLGKLGTAEFSAPTLAQPIMFVFIALGAGFSQAGSTIIAQYTGMKRQDLAEKNAAQAILTTLVLSSVFSLVGILSARAIVSQMALSKYTIDLAVTYMVIELASVPFMFVMQLNSGILRGWGNSVIALRLTFVSVMMNVVLDPIFIFGFKQGVAGAAIATFISRFVIAVYFTYLMFSGKYGFKLRVKDFKPDFSSIMQVIKIGLPASFGQAVTSLGFTLIMGVVSRFGVEVVSAYGVGQKISQLMVNFASGVSLACASMIGQFLGADRPDLASRTVKKAAIFTFSVALAVSTLLFFFGHNVTQFFVNDPKVIEMGEIYFRLISFSLPFFTTLAVFMDTLRGSGHTVQSTIIDIVRLWGIRIPIVTILAEKYGFRGVFYGMIISNISAMFLAMAFLVFGNWKKKIVKVQKISGEHVEEG
ncbi:MAG TPA: MATE family efflux transporter [Petrotogaceae bacterium]|nr:MATE family efflux transporter [Petrotogaceae bacterium]HOG34617.1 MATE family efflux transporter [Petrotogaceae bacterium]HPA92652.1 MATE family efflux transporter [Petrotogaceae bacterium]HPG48524.1 MATE family efflux transporter [Petrotogaceae bacterium]HPO25962.1 MATE family efflux transporter [Petrotogaceae bacterium]